jgi:hypothetical protein
VENCTKEQLETLIDKKAVPESPAIFQHLVALGMECVRKIPKQRPKMEKVLEELEAMASRHQIQDLVHCRLFSEIILSPGICLSFSCVYYQMASFGVLVLTNCMELSEHYSRGQRLCSHSRTPQHFMEPKGSLPHSQELSTCTYPEPDPPPHPISSRSILIWSNILVILVVSFPLAFPQITYTHLSFPPFVLHAQPISSSSTWSF